MNHIGYILWTKWFTSREQTNPPTSPTTREASTQTRRVHANQERDKFHGLRCKAQPQYDDLPRYALPNYDEIKEIAKNFCVFTSFDGIGHIFLSHKRNSLKWKNKVYLLAFLAFIIMDIYYMVRVTQRYLEYNVIAKKKVKYHKDMDFPGVTICNMNKIKAGHRDLFYPPKRESSSGHTLKEMLIKCSFAGKACDTADFHWFWSNDRGNCYTFNNHKDATGHDIPSKKLFLPGKTSSLILTLDVNLAFYSPKSDKTGMIVSLHDNSRRPDLCEDRRELSPGMWFIGMMEKKIHNLYADFGRCWRNSKEANREKSFYADKYKYTRTCCRSTCVQVQAMKEFKCCIKSYPCNPLGMKTMFEENLDASIKPCNTAVPNNMTKAKFTKWLQKKRAKCQQSCLPACNKTEIHTLYSAFNWPQRGSVDYNFFMKSYRMRYNCCESDIETYRHLQGNYITLELFFSNFDVTVYEEEPKYKLTSVLAGVGAMMGACVGFSLTTALEISEFFWQTMHGLFQRHCNF